jgi:sugar lactone lactonase YvrE
MRFAVGSDGIAISPDGKTLFYCPLTSRHLYSVSVDALADRSKSDADVAATVKDLGEKGGAADGLESDAQGRVYVSDYEHNAICRRSLTNEFETLVHDPRVLWPDTLSLAADGYLYFTANQVERQPAFHNGHDLRVKPYVLFRVKVDGTRIQN